VAFSGVLGFLDWNSYPLSRWEGSVIYTGYINKIKLRSSAQFKYFKFLVLMAVELNLLVWIEIEESPSSSGSPCLAMDKDEFSSGSKGFPSTGFISSSNYPTRLKLKLSEDSGLDVLVVAMRRASLGGSIDTCHDLRWVRKWPLHKLISSDYFTSS